jgi:hypothetical protein
MGLGAHDPRVGAAGVLGDHCAILEELDAPGEPANLDLLADKAERDAVAPPFEADHAVEFHRPAHDDVEWLRQRLGQRRQQPSFLSQASAIELPVRGQRSRFARSASRRR